MVLNVTGKFALDPGRNPPPLRSPDARPDGALWLALGRGVRMRLATDEDPLVELLDARVVVSRGFKGLGSVEDACAVLCASNSCLDWARRNGRPRVVAKVIGVMLDQPRYVLLTQPKLTGANRWRHESRASRVEAGLVPFVLVEPGRVECARCPGPNVGEVSLRI